MSVIARHAQPRRRGMKVLAALLSTVCALELLIAFEHIPLRGFGLPQMAMPSAPRLALDGLGEGVSARLSALGERARELAWAAPVLEAGAVDIPLRGAFSATGETSASVAFEGALVRLSDTTWRTQPIRIAAGEEAYAAGETFARRLAAAPDAQIELRRIVPNDTADEAEVAPSPLCGGDRPGVLALLHRSGQVDLMLFRDGVMPGPTADAAGVCGVWSFARP